MVSQWLHLRNLFFLQAREVAKKKKDSIFPVNSEHFEYAFLWKAYQLCFRLQERKPGEIEAIGGPGKGCSAF